MATPIRKTKIVCTMGPNLFEKDLIADLMKAGMNVARFNFSHGDHESHKRNHDYVCRVRDELGLPVATLLDTKGPEVRVKSFKEGRVTLQPGQLFTLTADEVDGDETRVSITYKNLPQDVQEGTSILIDDGLIGMVVEKIEGNDIICRVNNAGVVSNNKGVNIPNVHLSMPFISEKDRSDIIFAAKEGFDFIAASFTRSADDILQMRQILKENGGSHVNIIAKIENMEGVENIDEILRVVDGVMVARGDLGVEVPLEVVPSIQKELIQRCLAMGKPVITATQMLDSMIEHPRPTRAEITDVANAIYDGTSAIMLSGETAAGQYPVEAVQTMDAIARRTEANIDRAKPLKVSGRERLSITAAMAHAACTTAVDIGADAILTVSQRGVTAQMVSRFRPQTPVVALLLDAQVRRQMSLYWGVEAVMMPYARSTDELVEFAVEAAEKAGIVKSGDLVVITAGVPVGIAGTTNMIRVQQVGGSLINAIGIGSYKASGRLCVCRTMDDVAEKFHEGDVLVMPYTTNAMLPYIRKAAAVITEETSAECHTATIGLALDKPVIIGAVDATRRLTDGTMVSVDCGRGVVQTLPQ